MPGMRYREVRADRNGRAAIELFGVAGVAEFRVVVARERSRSERSHLPFTVLICTVRGDTATNGHGSNGHGSNGHGSNGHGSNGNGHAAARHGRDAGATAEIVARVLRRRLR